MGGVDGYWRYGHGDSGSLGPCRYLEEKETKRRFGKSFSSPSSSLPPLFFGNSPPFAVLNIEEEPISVDKEY